MEPESENPEPLRRVIREWKVAEPLPPRFQDGVWRRIEQAQTRQAASAWAVVANWIATVLPRPALAASYVAVLLTIGLTAGWAQARQEKARVSNEMSLRYVQSVDPYQSAR